MASHSEKKVKDNEGTKDEAQKIVLGEKRKANSERLDAEPEGKSSPVTMKIGQKTPKSVASGGISIKVGPMKSAEVEKKKTNLISKPKKGSIAAAFNDESDEEEEIPKEAKMRMRNLGKDTVTSSGPNSFNKSKQGFTNYGKLLEKEMKLVKK